MNMRTSLASKKKIQKPQTEWKRGSEWARYEDVAPVGIFSEANVFVGKWSSFVGQPS